MQKSLIVFASCLVVGACSSVPTIATDVTYCCQTGTEDINTFRVEFEDMPEFLKPMLRDEASLVLSTKGLEYTEGDAHAVLSMSFVNKTQEQVDSQQDGWDGEEWGEGRIEAWEQVAPAGGVRFIAQVILEMKNTESGELIWSGSMQRIHNVYEGSYMHDAPARTAMRNAFLEMFADYPNPRLDTE
jgi:hypothetical protein